MEAIKASAKEQAEKEAAALKEAADQDMSGREARKEKKVEDKAAEKAMLLELKEIEKERLLREKERQQRWREAAGLAKPKAVKRLMDAPAGEQGSPSKAARVAE